MPRSESQEGFNDKIVRPDDGSQIPEVRTEIKESDDLGSGS